MRHDTAMKKSHNVKSKLYFVGFVIYDSIMGMLAFTNYTFLLSFVSFTISFRFSANFHPPSETSSYIFISTMYGKSFYDIVIELFATE